MVTDHLQPFHLLLAKLLALTFVALEDPVFEVARHRLLEGRQLLIQPADAADQRN
ncbi:hypothetical protein D3C71_2108060 [compost metagenome]